MPHRLQGEMDTVCRTFVLLVGGINPALITTNRSHELALRAKDLPGFVKLAVQMGEQLSFKIHTLTHRHTHPHTLAGRSNT